MTPNELLAYPRGRLLDNLCAKSGIAPVNIVNAGYGLRRPMALRVGDLQYLFFGGPARRLQENAGPLTDEETKELESMCDSLGLRSFSGSAHHTLYGLLTTYAWHLASEPSGAHFTPLYHLLDEVAKRHPDLGPLLRTVRRRLGYTEILEEELQYIDKTLRPEVLIELPGWIANKAESLVSANVESILLLLEARDALKGGSGRLRIEDIPVQMEAIDKRFTSINDALDGYLLVQARHHATHRGKELFHLRGEGVVFEATFDQDVRDFGIMGDYIDSDILSGKPGVQTERRVVDGKPNVVYVDPRFPHVEFLFRQSKQGVPVREDVSLHYSMTVKPVKLDGPVPPASIAMLCSGHLRYLFT